MFIGTLSLCCTLPVLDLLNIGYFINCNIVHIHISLMFCHYMSCIYSYRLWNVLTVLLTVILPHIHISLMFCHYVSCIYSYKLKCFDCVINCNLVHIHISLMFCHYVSCIYSYRLWNVLTVIFSHIHISLTFCWYRYTISLKLLRLLKAANTSLMCCILASSALNCCYLCTELYDITTQKTVNVISLDMRTSNLTFI